MNETVVQEDLPDDWGDPLAPLPPLDDGVPAITKKFFFLVVFLCVGFVVWTVFGKLDIVSLAAGEVKPQGQIKKIQHLEGGIVSEISVKEGAEVKAGQVLVYLESIQTEADVEELSLRLLALDVEIGRLRAEADGVEKLNFRPELTRDYPDLTKRTKALFETRRKSYLAEVDTQRELINQRKQTVLKLNARLKNSRNSLKLLNEQVALGEDLLERNLTTKFRQLELMGRQSNMKSQAEEGREALKGARAALKGSEAQLKQLSAIFRANARGALEKARREFDELSQRQLKFQDSLARTVLITPVDGIIKTIHVTTLGGVVKPGETVVEIVPLGDRLIIEAQLPTQDIGYVVIGQKAVIRLNSPDLARFGSIDGKVTEISPDKLIRDDGLPYFRIRIETEQDHFEKNGQIFRLFPGTQVLASIQIGQRTVLEYLLEPFIGSFSQALREK
ncbi:MAG: HlyD family type I secretion periplasmic adaptor subunit [Alphaproteobacteria bacterium]|nr:HlyD family type I secretion periplasmic adaptor subunit [Alphaproteobacteria bacterium]